MQVKAAPGTFLTLDRTWREGEKLQVTLPMGLHTEAIAPETPDRRALLYGPLLLVALSDKPVTLEGEKARFEVVKRKGAAATFRTRSGEITFMPFYKVKDERYTTYLTLPNSLP